MNFSLNIVCKNELAAEKREQAALLLSLCGIAEEMRSEVYWKDPRFSQLLLGAKVEAPDFNLIKLHLCKIAGGDITVSSSMEAWEFYRYISLEELASEENAAFVSCEIF